MVSSARFLLLALFSFAALAGSLFAVSALTIQFPGDSHALANGSIVKAAYNYHFLPLEFIAPGATSCWYDLGGSVSYPLKNCRVMMQASMIYLPDADYVLNVYAKGANNETDVDSHSFSVDTRAPQVNVTQQVPGTFYRGSVPLKFTYADPLPSSGVSECWYQVVGSPARHALPGCDYLSLSSAYNSSTGQFKYNATLPLPAGAYSIRVYAKDAAGNVGSAQASFMVAAGDAH